MTEFHRQFGKPATAQGFTPGRVNLIGEHTDYNGGAVLPTALSLGVTVSLRLRHDDRVRVVSDRFEAAGEAGLGAPVAESWFAYVVGALKLAMDEGIIAGGADVALSSNLPDGAGLSSSAAVTVGVLDASAKAAGATLNPVRLAKLAQRVENEIIGVPCGIMDQMAVALARSGQGLLLDTYTGQYELIDLPARHVFAVVHSGHHRRLSDGRYAVRRQECEAAAKALGVDHLCRLDDVEVAADLPSPLASRARHCVTEHRRTLRFAEAMKAGDIATMGTLMNQSHRSMRDDFDVSLPSIDRLVDAAVELGAVGARLTGGGFGGCIVACVPEETKADWWAALSTAHPGTDLVG